MAVTGESEHGRGSRDRAPIVARPGGLSRSRYPSETALTLGRFVAGSSARAKARRLGIIEETVEAEEHSARAAALKPRRQTVHLLGRDIPVLAAADGTPRAEDDGKPESAKGVRYYIARAFGDRLGEARAAMETLATSLPPEELNRIGFRLDERFRPDVPEGAQGVTETFSARVSPGSLASPEEITVCRLLDDRRTRDLIYGPDAEGNFVFRCMRER